MYSSTSMRESWPFLFPKHNTETGGRDFRDVRVKGMRKCSPEGVRIAHFLKWRRGRLSHRNSEMVPASNCICIYGVLIHLKRRAPGDLAEISGILCGYSGDRIVAQGAAYEYETISGLWRAEFLARVVRRAARAQSD